MKVLMFGWEFPPFNSGGLGVACQHLVESLASQGTQVTFVLPKKMNCHSSCCKMVYADSSVTVKAVNSLITSPYLTSKQYQALYLQKKEHGIYSHNLLAEVARYGLLAGNIAQDEPHDIIHAHDWLSFPAGIHAKKTTGKPLILHVHATEFDRTGGIGVNQAVYEIEKVGFETADAVIAVSNFTRQRIIQHYGIRPEKVFTVHNGINYQEYNTSAFNQFALKAQGKKIVLYVGRITIQKGPDYFVQAAKKVVNFMDDVLFVVAGSGDMEIQMIEQAAASGLADKFIFAGFLRDQDLIRVYQMADLYVMSSVSEPFGLTPLESLVYGTPVLITYQSGVAEILNHALKVDFWDTDEMANKIISVLQHKELHQSLGQNGHQEVKNLSWEKSAKKCLAIYDQILLN